MAHKMEFFWENDNFPNFLRWLAEDMEYNTKMIIDAVEEPYHYEGIYTRFKEEKYKDICNHKNQFYQPEERDTNIPESYTCNDCGKEFDIPEPDFDLNNKE